MPDLFFHFSTSYLLTRWKKMEPFSISFILGSILPDLPTRALDIALSPFRVEKGWFFLTYHTPIGLILFSYLLSFLFEEKIRILVFGGILGGSVFHLFLDSLQESFYYSNDFVFFPFSFRTFSLNLFYYNDTSYLSIFIFLSFVFVFILKKR